jgi:hypothetical protein
VLDSEQISLARAKARAAYDQARARRERAKADLIERRVIEVETARDQLRLLAEAVRRQLDLAPSFLPADLSPEVREASSLAMAEAICRALRELEVQSDRIQKEVM